MPKQNQTSPESILQTLPEQLPLLPLRGVVLFPLMWLPITVGQPRSLRLIEDLIASNQNVLALAASKHPGNEAPTPEEIFTTGVVARIHRMVKSPDGTVRLILQGVERIHIQNYTQAEPYYQSQYALAPDISTHSQQERALAKAAQDLFAHLVTVSPKMPEEMESAVRNVKDNRQLLYLIASSANLKLDKPNCFSKPIPWSKNYKS